MATTEIHTHTDTHTQIEHVRTCTELCHDVLLLSCRRQSVTFVKCCINPQACPPLLFSAPFLFFFSLPFAVHLVLLSSSVIQGISYLLFFFIPIVLQQTKHMCIDIDIYYIVSAKF